MDEMKKPVSDTIQQMAEGLETSGMSRRERRERAMRLAAEEAARKAAEEAQSAPEPVEEAPVVTPLFADEIAAPAPEKEIEPEEEPVVEEPTREFTPVSLRALEEDKQPIFNLDDEDEDFDEEDADDDYDDEEDEDDEDDEPRRGFFAKLRGRRRDEDEDEDDEDEDDDDLDDDDDDYDDEDDDEDDEDEDDEDDRPAKSRRGLFGFRKKADYDDDDDDDDDDDYDDDEDDDDEEDDEDEDDDDEYDEYEDDDEYDSYDDDRVHRSFGYHFVGVMKWVLRIIFVLLVCVIVLNFLYVAGNDNIVPAMHEAMGDNAAFHLLFFGYDVRTLRDGAQQPVVEEQLPEENDWDGFYDEPEVQPEPEIAIPDLDTNGDITESPVVDVSPVSEDNSEISFDNSIG